MKLTAASLNSMPEGNHRDHIVPGLIFDVGPKRKAWRLRYRAHGKQPLKTLGFYLGDNAPPESGSMGLGDARNAARAILNRIEVGAPVSNAQAQHPKTDDFTIEKMINEYETMKRAKGGRGVKSLDEALRAVRKGLADYMSVPARQFTKADLRDARDAVAKGVKRKGAKGSAMSMSDRFLAYCSPIFLWASQEDKIEHDFTSEVLRVGPKLVKRRRVLSPDELRAIWRACSGMNTDVGHSYGRLIKFLMVTAQRREEGATLRFGDILGERWKLTTKGDKPHRLKLPKLALDIVGDGTVGKYVFEGGAKDKPISGWSKFKRELDRVCGVSGWRLHDLRRTAATILEEDLETPPHIVHAILNHEKEGLTGVYLQGELERAKGEALAKWADHLAAIVGVKIFAKA